MSALGSSYMEVPDFFETGGTRGVSKDSIDNIPKIRITMGNKVDETGENICCSVCLQVGFGFT